MTTKDKTVLISTSSGVILVLIYSIWFVKGTKYAVLAKAFLIMVMVLFLLLAGSIFCFFTRTKEIGQGLLLSSILILLIGFGVCTLVN